MKKVMLFFIAIFFFSCEDSTNCYVCVTTHVETTSIPIEGYPNTYNDLAEEHCGDMSDAQIQYYADWNKGSTTETVDNYVITDRYTTECKKE
jgi:hypothetical protein